MGAYVQEDSAMIYSHVFATRVYELIQPIAIGVCMCIMLAIGFVIGYYHQRFNRLERKAQREIDELKRDIKVGQDRESELIYRITQLKIVVSRRNGVSDSILEQVDDIVEQFQRLRKTARKLRGENG
jgi:hypothetical protein